MKDLKSKVEHILLQYPESRDSDAVLTCYFWAIYHDKNLIEIDGRKYVALRTMIKLPREDALSRVRRKFQEQGLYLPTDLAVAKKRRINMECWRDWNRRQKR